jgi:hypothetical protein
MATQTGERTMRCSVDRVGDMNLFVCTSNEAPEIDGYGETAEKAVQEFKDNLKWLHLIRNGKAEKIYDKAGNCFWCYKQ